MLHYQQRCLQKLLTELQVMIHCLQIYLLKFLTESHRGNNGKQDEVVVYSENPSFNESIDELYGPFVVLAGSYQASEVLYQMDRQVYQDALTEYLQEPKAENE